MADSDNDDLDIYIRDQEDNIEDELYIYLEEKRVDKKVSKYLLFIIILLFKY